MSLASVNPAQLEDLKAVFQSGNLVLFVGAGTSMSGGLPGWPSLAQQVLDEAGRRRNVDGTLLVEARGYLAAKNYIEALSALRKALGDAEFFAFVERLIGDTGRNVPPVVKAIAALRDKLRAVVTTNLDRFLERAFFGEWPVFVDAPQDLAQRRCFILKPHGTLGQRDTYVFTREDYDQAIANNSMLRTLYYSANLLFVGFGLNDDNLEQILSGVRAKDTRQPPQHFALLSEALPYKRNKLERSGIRVLEYENSDGMHQAVTSVLEALRDSIPSSAPRV